MRIAVLGPLEILTQDSVPVALPGATERLLLGVLVAGAPGVVGTDVLVEALWNGDPPPAAVESLRAQVARLRSALEPGLPERSSGQYVLRRASGYALAVPRGDVDAMRFADLAARGSARLAAGDAREAVRFLTTGLGLWRGEPYEDWPEATFAADERGRLTEIRDGAEARLREAQARLTEDPGAEPDTPMRTRGAVAPTVQRAPAEAPDTGVAVIGSIAAPAHEDARRRTDRPRVRRRTMVLVGGLVALLVGVLVAAGLTGRSEEQDAEVAAADRVAELSTTEDSLDVALLLAAQSFRIAETPATQDALLTALAGHGRIERVVPFSGVPQGPVLSGGGRTLTFGIGDQVVAWSVGSATLPHVLMDIPDEFGSVWVVAAPSPIENMMVATGLSQGGVPWLGTVSTVDGTYRVLLEGDQVGGTPVEGAVTADGRRFLLVVAEPDPAAPRDTSNWRLIDVDPTDGATRETGVGGTVPARVSALRADFADDAGSFVLWEQGVPAATLVEVTGGRQTPIPEQVRQASSLGFRAHPSGATHLWDDGAVNLIDRNGATIQQLGEHQDVVQDVAVSPDGTWAVTVGDGGAVVRWRIDPVTGRWSYPEFLAGHRGRVVGVEVDTAGREAVTVSLDGTVIVWDMSADGGAGEPYPGGVAGRWIAGLPEFVEPGGLLVAPTGPAGPDTSTVAATFLEAGTGEVIDDVVVGDSIFGVSFGSSVSVSPDRSMVAVTWGLGTTVLDARTREEVARIVLPATTGDIGFDGRPLPATVVWCAQWTPDGSHLLLGADRSMSEAGGGYLAVVNTRTWQVDGERVLGGAVAQAIEPSPDGQLLAVASQSSPELIVLGAADLELVRTVRVATDDPLGALSFSPDGRWLAGGSFSGELLVFDTRTWQPVGEPVALRDNLLLQAEWLPDSRTVVMAGPGGAVSLVDVDRGVVRDRALPASGEPGPGYFYVLPGPSSDVVVLGGQRTGRRYSMEPSAWLRDVCAMVGRDLTRAEWDRNLPDRPYRPTCTDLS